MKILPFYLLVFFFALSARAQAFFYYCSPYKVNSSIGCHGRGCLDISIGVLPSGDAKAVFWRMVDHSRFHKLLVRIGKVQEFSTPFNLDGSRLELTDSDAPFKLISLKLTTNHDEHYPFQFLGSARVSENGKIRAYKIQCLKLDSTTFNSWAFSIDNGYRRQFVMRELIEAMSLENE
jgi:hypothetical protein